MTHESPPRAWVEVKLESIAHNLDIIRQATPNTALMPVIKAGAYGHGLEPVARRLDNDGICYFGVANVGEARRISRAGVRTRPFILGPCFPQEREELVLHNWGCTLSSFQEIEHYQSLAALYNKSFLVHLAVDTGMGREGFLPQQLPQAIEMLKLQPNLVVEGLMSHQPSADEDIPYTQGQIELFTDIACALKAHFPNTLQFIHTAASAGGLGYEIPIANLSRPGLMLYGISPIASIYDGVLRSTMRLLSRITLVRELPAGHGVAYGRSYITTQPTRVATIGIGYADGWSRALSNKGAKVIINGQACPLLGRVTMDQVMADVSALPFVAEGDEAQLIGPGQTVQDVARMAGTIPWEILTGLGPRLPRIYH